MRYIAIDELTEPEHRSVKAYLAANTTAGAIEGVHWISLPDDLTGEAQFGHQSCGPFFFACELDQDRVSFELLVRCGNALHCSCICYATPTQREYLLRFIDCMIAHTGVNS